MGIDKQSDVSANIQIGPTDQGMVRIYIEADDGTVTAGGLALAGCATPPMVTTAL